jgi:hypothetical protein
MAAAALVPAGGHVTGVTGKGTHRSRAGKTGDRMAAGQSDFTQTNTSRQAEVPGPEAQLRSSGAVSASAAGPEDAGPAVARLPGAARAGRPDRERHRYAWLYDDEDIWGADRVDCVPPVIDGDDWRAPRI